MGYGKRKTVYTKLLVREIRTLAQISSLAVTINLPPCSSLDNAPPGTLRRHRYLPGSQRRTSPGPASSYISRPYKERY